MDKFKIVFENDEFAVVNKSKGIITHGSVDKNRENLFDLLKAHYKKFNKDIFLLHRLDKDTSGLMLFSLNEKRNKELQTLIEEKELKKIYLAKVVGIPSWFESTLLKDYLKKVKVKGIEKQTVVQKGGDVALLNVKNLADNIVEIELKTGRMHQIRIQLSSRGYPIVGDPLYGDIGEHSEGLHLHSTYLSFNFLGRVYEFLSPPEFFKEYKR